MWKVSSRGLGPERHNPASISHLDFILFFLFFFSLHLPLSHLEFSPLEPNKPHVSSLQTTVLEQETGATAVGRDRATRIARLS